MLRNINRSVALFVLFTLLATATASGIAFIYSASQFRAATESQLTDRARAYAHELNGLITSIEVAVDATANQLVALLDPKAFKPDAPDNTDYFLELEKNLDRIAAYFDQGHETATSFYIRFDPALTYGTAGIFYADVNADGKLEKQVPTDISLYDPSDRERVGWFYEPMTFESGDWMVPYYNANIQTYMVSYVAPILVDNRPVGIVGVDVDFRSLNSIADSHLGAGKVVLLDRDYAFMVHDQFSLSDRLDTIDQGKLAYMKDIMSKSSVGMIQYQLASENKVLGYAKLQNAWTVIVSLTRDEALQAFNRSTFTLLSINLLVSLVLAILGLFFSRFVNRLQNKNSSLELKVTERTKQLVETNEYLEETVAELQSQQAELTLVNNELATSLQRQQNMQNRLVETEKLAALGGLVAGVAHEVNTPLGNAITLNSYLMDKVNQLKILINKESQSSPQLMDNLEDTWESILLTEKTLARIAQLIDHFKLVSNVQDVLDLKKINLYSFFVETANLFNERLESAQHHIAISGDPLLEITTSPTILGHILYQIINNSIVHGFEGQTNRIIKITYIYNTPSPHPPTGHGNLVITIEDNGWGIAPGLENRIFHPFVTTKKNKGAVGLGLHIVHNLVTQSLNGSIVLDIHNETGTKFVIEMLV